MFTLGPNLLDATLTLAHASAAAYLDDPKSYPFWQRFGMDGVCPFPTSELYIENLGSASGFVACNTEHLVVAFRGSDDYLDLAVNLTASHNSELDYYGGAVHHGFAMALEAVWIELRAIIDQYHRSDQRIWLTGHSLGGALATLAAKRLDSFLTRVRCITFGQPRVGDPLFYRNYTVDHDRFVNELDMIPKLPPRSLFARYWHVGSEQILDAAGNHAAGEGDTSLLEDLFFGRLASNFNLGDAWNENVLDQLIQRGREDHRMATYVARVERLIAGRDGARNPHRDS